MKKFLSAVLVFDVLLPALVLGVPSCLLLWALAGFQDFVQTRTADLNEHKDRVRMVEALNRELQPVQAKMSLLQALLSNNDIEARVDHSILAALDKFSPDEIERTLNDLQYSTSTIGPAIGDGRRLSLKFSSRWEPLNVAAMDWETRCPNLLLETLSVQRAAVQPLSAPHLESTLSYFVITENEGDNSR
jgi:hypothetical protein